MTPTQRSLKLMREAGYYCEVVEHWNAFTRRRNDLLGFADLLCLKEGEPPLLLQVTAAGSATRIKKILDEPRAELALKVGFNIYVHGWRRLLVKRGGKAKVWKPKIHVVQLEDFIPDLVADTDKDQ